MNRLIPWHEFDAEVDLVRYLIRELPWRRADGSDDRSIRAEYRRWTTSDGEPTPLMLAPLWRRIPADGWNGLNDDATDRAVHHAALVLHLIALGDEGGRQAYQQPRCCRTSGRRCRGPLQPARQYAAFRAA